MSETSMTSTRLYIEPASDRVVGRRLVGILAESHLDWEIIYHIILKYWLIYEDWKKNYATIEELTIEQLVSYIYSDEDPGDREGIRESEAILERHYPQILEAFERVTESLYPYISPFDARVCSFEFEVFTPKGVFITVYYDPQF